MSALVVAEDPEVGLQDAGDVAPDAQIAAERIDEDQRWQPLRSVNDVMDDEAVGPGESHARGLLVPARRASRKKVHQYQMRAIGAPMSMAMSRPGSGVVGITSMPAAAVAPTR